jgi:type IV pilus assembly protein PilY1
MSALATLKKLAFAGLLFPALAQAEDIDLFQGGAPITGNKPNIVVFVDNSANWNSNAQHWPGGIKQGQSELNALKNVIANLTNDVRVGLMFFVKGAGSDPDGGYVRYGVRDMDTTNKAALQNLLAGVYPNFNDQNSGQQVATANAKYGEGLYEVFKYYSGGSAYAGGTAALRDFSGNGSPTVAP